MAATRVSTGTAGGSGTTASPITGAVGVTVAIGDLIVVVANSNGTHVANGMSVSDPSNGTYNIIDDTQQGNASSKWMQTFYKIATASLTSTDLITMTPYAAATATSFVVDVFRSVSSWEIDEVEASGATATSAYAPDITFAPLGGDLVLSLTTVSSGTATQPTPFLLGASGKTPTCSIAYVLSADGASTYGGTWVWGTSGSSALQTTSFRTTGGGAPPVVGEQSYNTDASEDMWDISGQMITDGSF